jgi:hypothetical protein
MEEHSKRNPFDGLDWKDVNWEALEDGDYYEYQLVEFLERRDEQRQQARLEEAKRKYEEAYIAGADKALAALDSQRFLCLGEACSTLSKQGISTTTKALRAAIDRGELAYTKIGHTI